MTINQELLALLERGRVEAETALEALKASWVSEDAEIAARRAAVLEQHEQGAKDRDAKRTELGGAPAMVARQSSEAPLNPGTPLTPPD